MTTRIVFMGSPDFAIPSLNALLEHFFVVGVVTQPDRPAGRGRKSVSPPVKILALEHNIPVLQPIALKKDQAAKDQLSNWKPDVIVVAAFGQILEKQVLQLPVHGCVNVHASLLPRWRGVSPIQSAILYGDKLTGITIMKMDEGIDTGDILKQRSVRITPEDTGGSLFIKLASLGGDLLVEVLADYLSGKIVPQPQEPSPTPYAPMLHKSDGELNFNKPAAFLSRQIRAYHPWPGTFTFWQGKMLKIPRGHANDSASPGIGVFTRHDKKPAVGTSEGILVLDEVQPEGKKPISGEAFLLGARGWGID
jgi:methionyl-tRNA formyltransferase